MKYYKSWKDAHKAAKPGQTVWYDSQREMYYISCI